MLRSNVANKTPAAIIFVGSQAMREVGERTPGNLAWLIDPALPQRPLNQADSPGPGSGCIQVPARHAIDASALKKRPFATALWLQPYAIQLIRKMAKLSLTSKRRGNHHTANHRVGMFVPNGGERNVREAFLILCAIRSVAGNKRFHPGADVSDTVGRIFHRLDGCVPDHSGNANGPRMGPAAPFIIGPAKIEDGVWPTYRALDTCVKDPVKHLGLVHRSKGLAMLNALKKRLVSETQIGHRFLLGHTQHTVIANCSRLGEPPDTLDLSDPQIVEQSAVRVGHVDAPTQTRQRLRRLHQTRLRAVPIKRPDVVHLGPIKHNRRSRGLTR
jgi:hypothetical protein